MMTTPTTEVDRLVGDLEAAAQTVLLWECICGVLGCARCATRLRNVGRTLST